MKKICSFGTYEILKVKEACKYRNYIYKFINHGSFASLNSLQPIKLSYESTFNIIGK